MPGGFHNGSDDVRISRRDERLRRMSRRVQRDEPSPLINGLAQVPLIRALNDKYGNAPVVKARAVRNIQAVIRTFRFAKSLTKGASPEQAFLFSVAFMSLVFSPGKVVGAAMGSWPKTRAA